MAAALSHSRDRLGTLAAWGLVCAVVVVFGRVVANDWVDFDDYLHVAKNPVFFPVSWQTLRAVWTPGLERLYVPVSYTVFAGECIASRAVAGGTATSDPPPALFHGVSLALHAAVVMLVFAILRMIVRDQRAAAAGALLFAIHPLQVESVAWAFEQRGLLAAMFSLAAVLLLLRPFGRGTAPGLLSADYLAATGLLALALLLKPIAVVTPLIAAALLMHRYRPPLKTVAMVLLPWVILAAGMALVTRAVQPAVVVDRNYPWLCRPLIAGDALAFYAEKIALPVKLCLQYGRTPPAVLADPAAPLRGLCVAMVLGAAFTLARGSWVRLPLALFLIPLTPVLGLTSFDFQQQSTVADRYVYLAMLGPAAALAVAAEELFESGRWRRLAAIGITAWMAVLGAAAAWQVGVWRDTGTLATQACRVTPRAPWPWILLAAHNLQAGDPLQAAACADRALDLEPGNQNAMFDRAEAAVQLGDAATADSMHTGMLRYGWDNGILVNGLYQRAVAHLRAGREMLCRRDRVGLGVCSGPRQSRRAVRAACLARRGGRAFSQSPGDRSAAGGCVGGAGQLALRSGQGRGGGRVLRQGDRHRPRRCRDARKPGVGTGGGGRPPRGGVRSHDDPGTRVRSRPRFGGGDHAAAARRRCRWPINEVAGSHGDSRYTLCRLTGAELLAAKCP